MEEKEQGICEVTEEITKWGATPYTVGIVKFKQQYSSPPHIQLTASQEGRPGDWAALLCTILELTETYLIIDFDGWKIINGVITFQQEVYPGAKCYWAVI
jgi:hypothetical protein